MIAGDAVRYGIPLGLWSHMWCHQSGYLSWHSQLIYLIGVLFVHWCDVLVNFELHLWLSVGFLLWQCVLDLDSGIGTTGGVSSRVWGPKALVYRVHSCMQPVCSQLLCRGYQGDYQSDVVWQHVADFEGLEHCFLATIESIWGLSIFWATVLQLGYILYW